MSSTLTSPVPNKNFTITITSIPEDDAIQDVTYLTLSSAALAFDYEASLPDPVDEYGDEEEEDGEVIASSDEFDDDEEPANHDEAVDEALETLQDMISPEQILVLTLQVTPAMIADMKAMYEAQDVGATTEVLITYYSEYGDPLFYHIFMGYISPVRKLNGARNDEGKLVLDLEMDVDEVRTFCLECPSASKPLPLPPEAQFSLPVRVPSAA